MEARGILRKARAEAVVERQHIVLLGLAPPQLDHRLKPLGMISCKIVRFRKILRQVKQLPFVVLERRARRMEGDRLPAVLPDPAMPEHFEILRLTF